MTIQERTQAFVTLGVYLKQLARNERNDAQFGQLNEQFFDQGQTLFATAKIHNGWFTEANVRGAVGAIADMLDESKINQWISAYIFDETHKVKKVGVIMAGNIPLVGFHDFLCVLMSGQHVLVKLSSDDKYLLPFVANVLISIEPKFKTYLEFTETRVEKCDAVIATGSGNTSRYFEYYFGKIPHIIRKNRSSVAVLKGHESQADLKLLGEDIFSYFGLGCRNVSKLFIPDGFDLNTFFNAIYDYKDIINHNKYANNFDYNRAVYLMGKDTGSLLENGFLFLVKSNDYASPVAVLFYEYYNDFSQLADRLKADEAQLQCIVSAIPELANSIPFGKAQKPELGDYSDNIDTMDFLQKL